MERKSSNLHLCCPHPSRSLSPTEPARPAIISLDGIFAVAALPEDHPHALKIPERRPGSKLAKTIIKSPSVVGKLKGQLKRKWTVRSLRAEVYDGDARRVGSEEVLERVERAEGRERSRLSECQEAQEARTSESETRDEPEQGQTQGSLQPASTPLEVPTIQLRDLTPPELDLSAYQLDGGLVVLATTPQMRPANFTNTGSSKAIIDSAVAEEVDATPKAQKSTGPGLAKSNSLRLTEMRISQQLRPMSQMTDSNDDGERLTPEIWSLHHRERPEGRGLPSRESLSINSQHRTVTPAASIRAPSFSSRLQPGREGRDSSSSIYSRGVSTDVPGPYELPGDLGSWPLMDGLPPNDAQDDASEKQQRPSPPLRSSPTLSHSAQGRIARLRHTGSSSNALRVPALLPSSGSTTSLRSNLTNGSKTTRFTERFTPQKKVVKKRRSIFKFLRASSRRQTRSISTPVLRTGLAKASYDGANDDNDTVTVQYELDQPAQTAGRSVSLGNLSSPEHSRRPSNDAAREARAKASLADYERHLSVNGDDRRRPSTSVMRLSEIQEDDQPVVSQSRKSLSTKSSKHRDSDSLMQSALERHVKEKAMMRTPSKRSIAGIEQPTPSFNATTWDEPSTVTPMTLDKDPFEASARSPPSTTKYESETHLSPPRTPIEGNSPRSSLSHGPKSQSKAAVIPQTPPAAHVRTPPSNAGSPLAAWSRYPSHTREERCGSAGPSDRVITRDFAVEITHSETGGSEESDPFHPGKKTLTGFSSARSSKHHMPKSRSTTFGTIARYYANIFSNPDFHLKGRRTSLAPSGQLKDPELEILPPVLPPSSQSQPVLGTDHESRHRSRLSHIKHHFDHGANRLVDRFSPGHHHRVFTDPATQPLSPVQFRQNDLFHDIAHRQANKPEHKSETDHVAAAEPTSPKASGALLPDSDDPISPKSIANHELRLDGAIESPQAITRSSPSKAELLSEAYQDCIARPTCFDDAKLSVDADREAMPPPPPLKSRKRASPSHNSDHLDPNATVRRFPSVTVVDDRKGHWRSVSFISVKSNQSENSFVRDSSRDLLQLIEEQKKQEREKLLESLNAV